MEQQNFYEQEFDSTLDALLELFKHLPESTVKIINPCRYQLMIQTAAKLTALLRKTMSEGEVNIEINDTFNLGSISVELDSLTITEPLAFSDIICKADNFEIYPLTNGNIRLDIAFQGVLKTLA